MTPVCPDAKLRKLVRNMIYDGILAYLLSIDMEEIRKALVKQFGARKAKAADLNWNARPRPATISPPKAFRKRTPFRVERMKRQYRQDHHRTATPRARSGPCSPE